MKIWVTAGMMSWCWTGTQAQGIGGIFSQGGKVLKEYVRQIAALQSLIGETEKGYRIMEKGLGDIGRINGDEFALHGSFFTGLREINPVIAGWPAVKGVEDLEAKGIQEISAAVQRWRHETILTSGESAMAVDMLSNVSGQGEDMLHGLEDLVTPGRLVMTDGERMLQIKELDRRMRELVAFVRVFIQKMDGLVATRERGRMGEF